MISELNNLECITLFTEDLPLAKQFYQRIFAAKTVYEDADSTVFKFESIMVNVLKVSEASQLIAPAKVGDRSSGSRIMFTIKVKNVDAVCAQLDQHGVKLLNGPIDRPWGRRTAAFSDPSGNAWEIAEEI
jgi:catechol 2,3-dioxygenase-like lactoylglutathione lyase family enzyme